MAHSAADRSSDTYDRQPGTTGHGRCLQDALPFLAGSLVIVLSLPTLGARSLWLDEGFTVTSTNQLAESLWQRAGSMGLYYVLMTPWSKVSLDPAWLRVPSLIFAALAVGLSVALARRHIGNDVAACTAITLPLLWGTVRYAQEVRAYSLTMLLAVATWWAVLELRDRATRRMWLLWVIGAAALVYSHPLTALILVAQLAFLRSDTQTPHLRLPKMAPWLLLLGAAVAPMAVATLLVSPQPSWVPPLGRHAINDVLEVVAGESSVTRFVLVGALLWATLALVQSRFADGINRALLLWLWLPVACLAAISIGSPMLLGRYLTPCLPAAAIALGVLIVNLRSTVLRSGVAAAVLLALFVTQADVQRRPGDEWAEAVEAVFAESKGPRTGLLFLAGAYRIPFELAALQIDSSRLNSFEPINPSDPWGSALRYPTARPPQAAADAIEQLDEVWIIEQRDFPGATVEPAPLDQNPDPLRHLGFCRHMSVELHREITVARFLPCDSRNQT